MNSFPIIENAKKRMSDLPVSELKNDCLVENHNLIYKVYNSSKKIKSKIYEHLSIILFKN